MLMTEDLRALIRDIPDFPKPGILFKDITPLMADSRRSLRLYRGSPSMRARSRSSACWPPRRAGSCWGRPWRLRSAPASLWRASPASCHMRRSAPSIGWSTVWIGWSCTATRSRPGARVLVHDDLLATGGTARALCDLVESLGGVVVGCGFLVELAFLGGRERLAPHEAHALLTYEA